MKILHVTNAYPFPAIPEYGVFVKEQIAALNRSGVQADVLFINAKERGKRAYLDAIGEIRTRAADYDAIHCHHLYSGLAAGLARTNKSIVLSFQNDWLHEVEIGYKPVQFALCNLGVKIADRVIFKSPIPKQFSGGKFVHMPNGVNEREFHVSDKGAARARLGLDAAATYLLFVSSKYLERPQKRYDRFSATLRLLQERDPTRDYRELTMVNQERSKVIDFLNASDVHLLCSDYEGSPNSVKEALCAGLAVVATDVGNVREMLTDVPACHVASAFDHSVLADLVQRSVADGVGRAAVREAFLAKDLSQEAVTQRLIALYRDLTTDRAFS